MKMNTNSINKNRLDSMKTIYIFNIKELILFIEVSHVLF
jgi:hypothetical protein